MKVTAGQFRFVEPSFYVVLESLVRSDYVLSTRRGEVFERRDPPPLVPQPRLREDDGRSGRYVAWNDAQGAAPRLSKTAGGRCRLPTEVEWQYA